jgi:hypothetical protein
VTTSHVAEDRILGGERQTGGLWTHRGRLVVRTQRADGTLLSVTLPDDVVVVLATLEARVAALEAKQQSAAGVSLG